MDAYIEAVEVDGRILDPHSKTPIQLHENADFEMSMQRSDLGTLRAGSTQRIGPRLELRDFSDFPNGFLIEQIFTSEFRDNRAASELSATDSFLFIHEETD